MVSLKDRIKREAGFMAKGAKVLPTVLAKKTKTYVSAQIQAGREQRRLELQAEAEAQDEANAAYKRVLAEELKKNAIKKAEARARAQAAGQGNSGGGFLSQLGQAGTRLGGIDVVGVRDMQKNHKAESPSNYIFSGTQATAKPAGESPSDYIFGGFNAKAVGNSKPLKGSSVVFEGTNTAPQQARHSRRHRHRNRHRRN